MISSRRVISDSRRYEETAEKIENKNLIFEEQVIRIIKNVKRLTNGDLQRRNALRE